MIYIVEGYEGKFRILPNFPYIIVKYPSGNSWRYYPEWEKGEFDANVKKYKYKPGSFATLLKKVSKAYKTELNPVLMESYFDCGKPYRVGGGSPTVFIYKNPTENEWNKYIPFEAVGYIDKDGNLYMEGYESPTRNEIIHGELIEILGDKLGKDNLNNFKSDKNYLNYGFCVKRYKDSNIIGISGTSTISQNYGKNYEKMALKLYKLSKEKCPYLNFKLYATYKLIKEIKI
jgi:hypothetical protein